MTNEQWRWRKKGLQEEEPQDDKEMRAGSLCTMPADGQRGETLFNDNYKTQLFSTVLQLSCLEHLKEFQKQRSLLSTSEVRELSIVQIS